MKICSVLVLAACLLFLPPCARALETGQPAPDFMLADTFGEDVSISDYKGEFIVLEWSNFDCPFVKKHYDSRNMQTLQEVYTDQGIVWLTIISSAKGKQGHYPSEELEKKADEWGLMSTSILLDPDGKAGQLYGAKTTPHMFIINPAGVLIYQGAIDDKATTDKNDVKAAKNYVRAALGEALDGKPVSVNSTQSYGCSVKYK